MGAQILWRTNWGCVFHRVAKVHLIYFVDLTTRPQGSTENLCICLTHLTPHTHTHTHTHSFHTDHTHPDHTPTAVTAVQHLCLQSARMLAVQASMETLLSHFELRWFKQQLIWMVVPLLRLRCLWYKLSSTFQVSMESNRKVGGSVSSNMLPCWAPFLLFPLSPTVPNKSLMFYNSGDCRWCLFKFHVYPPLWL